MTDSKDRTGFNPRDPRDLRHATHRLPADLLSWFDQQARANGLSRSELMRIALDRYRQTADA